MRCFFKLSHRVEFMFSFWGLDLVTLWFEWQLRVNLNGDQTQKVFDRILVNLGRKAPPVPGFRIRKGGKKLRY